MKTNDSTNACPKCGTTVPPEAPHGLCPQCVFAAAATPEAAPTATSQIPSLERLTVAFPQLQIIELIGRGGMGFVFKARQPHLDRFVALKLLPDSLAHDPQFAERFNREGRVLARLNHPNIVSIFDFGYADPRRAALQSRSSNDPDERVENSPTSPASAAAAALESRAPGQPPQLETPNPKLGTTESGFYYLMMEYVDGVNLRQAMQAGRFSPAEALTIVPKICEALQFAHEEGILHRDIKPENILLDAKGRVKIADFGIAKLVGEEHPDVSLTATGAALGTMHYMAPEQIEKPATVDHRADIYSLGVVFYELLTGELPLGRFGPPSAKTPVDSRVDEVVMRTLEREREKRFQSAGEMGTTVEHLTEVGAGARPSTLKPTSVTPAEDFILCHPRLPRMAQFITVFALVLMPAFWFIGLLTMDTTPHPNAYAEFVQVMTRMVTFWGELLTTVLLFIGGWKLRALKKSGPRLLSVALWINMVLITFVIASLILIENLVPTGEGGDKPMAASEAVLGALQFGALIFQIIALVWLRRNRAVLKDIFDSAATPRGPHGTMVIPPSAVVASTSLPRPNRVLKWALLGLMLLAFGLLVLVKPIGSWFSATFRTGPKFEVHYRVFEVDSAVADKLVPVAQRQTGATGNWQMSNLSPETLAALLNARVLKKHVMVDRRRPVPAAKSSRTIISTHKPGVKEAQQQVIVGWPIVSDNWGQSLANRVSNDIVDVDGHGFFGVRRQDGVLQLKMEHGVTHKIGDRPAVDVNIAYEGNAPNAGALAFFIPFARADDTTGYFLFAVEVLEATTKSEQPATPPNVNAAATNTTPFIRFTITAVELREVKGVRWLAIDYLDDVHGECDKSFPWENTIPGFTATTRATEFLGGDTNAPVRHQRIEYQMPGSIQRDALERLRDQLARMLERKSFRLEPGNEKLLFEIIPMTNGTVALLPYESVAMEREMADVAKGFGGSLKARIKVMPPRTDSSDSAAPSANKPETSNEPWSPTLAPGEKPRPNEILQEAARLAKKGQYEQALQRQIWYHHHALEFQPSQATTRLSLALSQWMELARRYPQARDALLEIREQGALEFSGGGGSFRDFMELSFINKALDEEHATAALFKSIPAQDPELARQCYQTVERLLVEAGEYALCASFIPDAQERFSQIRTKREKMLASVRNPKNSPGLLHDYAQRVFIKETRALVEILVGIGRKGEAEKIRDDALAVLNEPQLQSAVADAEVRVAKLNTQQKNP